MTDCPDLRPFFPHAQPLVERDGDTMLCEPDLWPGCGFTSLKEAAILYRLARAFLGRWLEIGGYTGWSASHIAAVGNEVVAVDPEYRMPVTPMTPIRQRAHDNLMRASLRHRVALTGESSVEFFNKHGKATYAGVFIDGDHSPPNPVRDAEMALAMLRNPGVIVLHDYLGGPVKDAVKVLVDAGLSVKVYDTLNGLAACWRGDVEMP